MKKKQNTHLQQTKTRMIVWFFVILFTVGLGLVWVIYGFQSSIFGLLCIISTAIPIGLILLFLYGLEKITENE